MKNIDLMALAGLLHDVGKFGQRSDIPIEKDSYDFQEYCPCKFDTYWTHQHSAYTADFLKIIVNKQKEDRAPVDHSIDNESFENICSKHHKPSTTMEWIGAIADRVASGFEREDFDKYNESDDRKHKKLKYYEFPLESILNENDENLVYDLKEFNSDHIFPIEHKQLNKNDYQKLYNKFEKDVVRLKQTTRTHFIKGIDYLLKKYTSFIPSSTYLTKANIPLYDHLKTTSSFVSALYAYHLNDLKEDSIKNYNENKFLLIAGDFFGIQKFIFSSMPTKYASKILRGKSAFIQIFIKQTAFDICDKLGLSSLSIVSDTAGKFEILAANNKQTKKKLQKIQIELNKWFLEKIFGQSGLGISFVEASCNDFLEGAFLNLRKRLAKQIEISKFQKFDLINQEPIFDVKIKDNAHLCSICDIRFVENDQEECPFCKNFIELGKRLVKNNYLIITTEQHKNSISVYNYFISFIDKVNEKELPKHSTVYDISNDEEFKGYAKWSLKAYVATNEQDKIIEFEKLAESSCGGSSTLGKAALISLKGDVDNMGAFLSGANINSFAKYNFISRLVDYFFNVNVSKMMDRKNLYTIFAGGDDLFILGA
jgi:CRISPR-associated protein Csm1